MKKTVCKEKIINYVLLYAGFLVYSLVSVLAKCASKQSNFTMMCFFLFGEIFVLGIYAVLWQQALKKFPLVVAMSNKGVTVIFSLIWSALLFQEEISTVNIVGSLMILFGIWMVSADE